MEITKYLGAFLFVVLLWLLILLNINRCNRGALKNESPDYLQTQYGKSWMNGFDFNFFNLKRI